MDVLIVLVVLGIGIAFLVSRSQRRENRRELESVQAVKTVAEEDVTRLGEDVALLDTETAGRQLDDGTRQDYRRALDAYDAAKAALDRVRRPEDVKAVTEILEDGRYAVACVQARLAGRPGALLLPGGGWLLLFFLVPLLVMVAYSVMPRGTYGGVEPGLTLEHYRRFFDPLYLGILRRTVILSALCTAFCLLLGYPVAYAIARSGRWKNLLLILVILPFWTSFLVRTFAMIFLLRDTGAINQLLLGLGVIGEPLPMLYTPGAVLLGMIAGHVPFMVLPIYASLEKLDPALDEAAEVLGARGWRRFWRVTWPMTVPGVVAGSLLVFIPALGSFLTPDLLGGAKVMLIGNLVQNQFTTARHWPFGAALSFLLMGIVLLGMLARLRWVREEPR